MLLHISMLYKYTIIMKFVFILPQCRFLLGPYVIFFLPHFKIFVFTDQSFFKNFSKENKIFILEI